MDHPVTSVAVIGAGLAGCEAALVLTRFGIAVTLYEARPLYMSPAHKTALPAELVCSNSLKSNVLPSAHGLLKAELRMLASPLLSMAAETAVPAGTALAVDRKNFSLLVQKRIAASPDIFYVQQEVSIPPPEHRYCIIAAGPLASEKLIAWLQKTFSTGSLHFYDAIAPIVNADTIDYSIVFPGCRWKTEANDYLNCPFTEAEYRLFYEALLDADRVTMREFEEKRFFESCLPIEVAAQRGFMAPVFGPMRPVGLVDPRTGKRPFAVCQLRRERVFGESYNLVGFQTRLKIPDQQRVFRMIPGLARAEFLRYGSIHRNTYLDSPALLQSDLSFRQHPDIFLAGQLCGNEGYTESIATGHLAAIAVAARIAGHQWTAPPVETALGALLHHVTASKENPFTPSNIHFGLFPPLRKTPEIRKIEKTKKQEIMCKRALEKMRLWIETLPFKITI